MAWSIGATTLQKLELDDMIRQSTDIVRGRVTGAAAVQRGSMIYTQYKVQVLERIKGDAAAEITVTVPGGTVGSLRQTFAGAPQFDTGDEQVFFLWRSRSGMVQVMGLTQGLMDIRVDAAGKTLVGRAATKSELVDAAGRPAADPGMQMGLTELTDRIRKVLGARQ